MHVDLGALRWAVVFQTGHLDPTSATVFVLLAGAYAWCYRRARNTQPIAPVQAGCFGCGIALWALATVSAIGAYAYVLFWMRALQVVLLLYVAPFFLAQGKPLTAVA